MTWEKFLTAMLSYLVILPSAVVCIAPMKDKLRYGMKKTVTGLLIITVVLTALGSWLASSFSLAPNTVLLPMLLIFFVLYHRCLDVHISVSAAVFVYVCTLMGIVSNISSGIDAVIYPESGAIDFTMSNGLIQLVLSSVVAALVFCPVRRFGSFLVNNLNSPRIWYITIVISSIVLCVNIIITPQKYETLYTNKVFLAYWVVLGMFMLMEILLSTIFYFIVNEMLHSAKTEEKKRILEMQESLFIRQQEYLENTARVRHDLKQAIRTLDMLAADDDMTGIKAFVKEYSSAMPENDTRKYCKNAAVNALLNYYALEADKNAVELSWNIEPFEDTGIKDTELCSVIGNVLDNAVTACCDITDGSRYIRLGVTIRGSSLFIVAVNSFDGSPRMLGGRYLSTHRGGNGIGLSSISLIAENYGGNATFHHSGTEFYSDIVIPFAKVTEVRENEPVLQR